MEREADSSPPSSAKVKGCMEMYIHFPIASSWCGAQFKKKHRDNFTLPLPLPMNLSQVIYFIA